MAWPNYVADGEVATAAQYNALVDSDAAWGGSVNASGYIISNLASIVATPSAVLDVSAGGFNIKGDVASAGKLSIAYSGADGFPLVLSTPGGASLNVLTGTGVAHAQIRTNTGTLAVGQIGDVTRILRLVAAPGAQESINTATGRLTITGSLDITQDLTVAGAMQITGAVTVGSIIATGNVKAATLTVTGAASAASLAISGVATIGGAASVGAALTVGGYIGSSNPDGYLYLGPQWTRVLQLQCNYGVYAASVDWTKTLGFSVDGPSNTGYIGGTALAQVICLQNLQCNGFLRTASASGFFVYSADSSRYLQISCANGANPVIYSSTAALTISANVTFTGVGSFAGVVSSAQRLTSAGDITISASASGSAGSYLQFSNNGQFGDGNPWVVSSTGIICFQSSIYARANSGFYTFNAANTQYISIGQAGIYSSTGTVPFTVGVSVAGASSIQSTLVVAGVLSMNAGGSVTYGNPLYIYNAANSAYGYLNYTTNLNLFSQSGTVAFVSCGISVNGASSFGATVDVSGAPGLFRALQGAQVVWYNAGNAQYGVLNYGATHPNIGSTTGVLNIAASVIINGAGTALDVVLGAVGNSIHVECPSAGASAWSSYGVSSNVNGVGQPFIYSATGNFNMQANFYVTGQVSATAHVTHGSGTGIEDIYASFYREAPEVLAPLDASEDEAPPVIETEVEVGAWTLAPAADGLHILCKRSKTEVLETVLSWSQFKTVPNPDVEKN